MSVVVALSALAFCLPLVCHGASGVTPESDSNDAIVIRNTSHSANSALKKAVAYLVAQQSEDGYFGEHPEIGFTGLAVAALAKSPFRNEPAVKPAIEKGVKRLLSQQKANGSFAGDDLRSLDNYRTAISIMALVAVDPASYADQIEKAQKFLITMQMGPHNGADKDRDKNFYGGFRYDEEKGRADMSNTQMALQALNDSGLDPDSEVWKRAVVFLNRCQNRSESNDTGHAANDGGGIYAPNETKVKNGTVTLPDGRIVYKSYGSMTYALLKCFIFAGVSKDDPRVQAAYDWIASHYTVEENPGLGQQGLYYYYNTMASTLAIYNSPRIKSSESKQYDWADDLVERLVALQREDGSWTNENDRWMEGSPVLVTAYASLALESALSVIAPVTD